MLDAPPAETSPHGSGRGPTRRRVLLWVATALIAGAGVAFVRRTAILRWFVAPPLGSGSPGRIGDAAAATLDATVLALLDGRVERAHYADFFRWRAANVPGMRALFERFAVRLDAEARRRGARSFAGAPRAMQRGILHGFRHARGGDRIVRSVFARDDERFARYVVREVFRIFARTDAWVLNGYSAWPGLPRPVADPTRYRGVS